MTKVEMEAEIKRLKRKVSKLLKKYKILDNANIELQEAVIYWRTEYRSW